MVVKIPGSELALARRGGAEHTLHRFHRRDQGRIRHHGHQRARQGGHQAERRNRRRAGQASHRVRHRLHAAAREVHASSFWRATTETGRIGTYQTKFVIPNLNKEEKRDPDQLGGAEQPARGPEGRSVHRGKDRGKRQATNPLVQDGQKLIPSVTRVFSKSRDMYVYLQAYQHGARRVPSRWSRS